MGVRAWPLIAPRSVIAATVERFFGSELRRLDPQIHTLMNGMVSQGLLTQSTASVVLQHYVAQETPLDQMVVEVSGVSETQVARALAEVLGAPLRDLQLREETIEIIDALGQPATRRLVSDPVDAPAAHLISLETARRMTALPVAQSDGQVTVAFADPTFGLALEELETTLGLSVRPSLAPRSVLEAAIQRVLDRMNIGTYLRLAGIISLIQLNDALELAQRTGVRLGRALMNRGYVTQEQFYQFLAEQASLPLFDLNSIEFDLGAFLLFSAAWIALDYLSYLIVLNAFSSLYYATFSAYKFYLVYRAVLTYSWAVLDNLGGLVVALALVAIIIYLVSTRFRSGSLIPYVFLSSYPFNIIALWLGQTAIGVPQSTPPGYFNVRYGILILPGVALFIAYLANFLMERAWPSAVVVGLALILAGQFATYIPNWPTSIITVVDGLGGSSAKAEPPLTARYLREHYDGGGILIDDTNSQAIHEARINMREYIATFSGPLWTGARENPALYVKWVVMHTEDESDRVTAALINNPNFTSRYRLEFEDRGYGLYRRIDASE